MMNDNEIMIESQIREIFGRVVYTHKTHEKCADILKSRSDLIKNAEIILSAVTTTSILAVLFGQNFCYQVVAALCSTALLCLTLYTKDFNLLALVEKHKVAALDILAIREELFSLLIDIRIGNNNIEAIQQRRDKLNADLVNTYKGAPKTTSKAYNMASKALKENEEFTFTDAEIDRFLPESLRRTHN